jgi:hypothetical protein
LLEWQWCGRADGRETAGFKILESANEVCADGDEGEDEGEDPLTDRAGVDGSLYRLLVEVQDGVPTPASSF